MGMFRKDCQIGLGPKNSVNVGAVKSAGHFSVLVEPRFGTLAFTRGYSGRA
jgi:hypothetical protein